MKNELISGRYKFEIVEEVPKGEYIIWNIGANMIEGYLPLVIAGGYDGCQVDINSMKAIKVKDAQTILKVAGRGQKTLKGMETYIKKYSNTKNISTKTHVERLKKAVEVMKTIKGVENLNK